MPSTYKPFDPKEYELSSVTIKTERNLHQVDITQGIITFNIFEHMDKPYLTGDLTFADTNRILEIIDFKGTEVVDFKFKLHQNDIFIEKRFVVRNVQNIVPSTDTDDVINNVVNDLDDRDLDVVDDDNLENVLNNFNNS